MQRLATIAPLQQFTALALSVALTAGVLASLSSQADSTHAAALASARVSAQLACAAPQRAVRS